jgi:uncharacterized protein YjbI with pentapeptide repeats
MANDEHVALLRKGVDAWNAWRDKNPTICPDLIEADLCKAYLGGANLSGANLALADLSQAYLRKADLNEANLAGAKLCEANLSVAKLYEADLTGANLFKANLSSANLNSADLSGAKLIEADLSGAACQACLIKANLSWANLSDAGLSNATLFKANLSGAKLVGAKLFDANLTGANLSSANLNSANLSRARLIEANISRADLSEADLAMADISRADLSESKLIGASLLGAALLETDLRSADLTGCHVYGVSAWGLTLDERTNQNNLVITNKNEPTITVDNIEVAQFIYLMLNNQRLRDVIDTITSKAVLILGRFTDARKAVLDALREGLRKRNYLPNLFDFDVPVTRDITETVSLLARMARFIIADLTDPSSIPKELEGIVPSLAVPVQPLIEGASRPYAMFKDYWKYDWVLPVHRYEGTEALLATFAKNVIAPAERGQSVGGATPRDRGPANQTSVKA